MTQQSSLFDRPRPATAAPPAPPIDRGPPPAPTPAEPRPDPPPLPAPAEPAIGRARIEANEMLALVTEACQQLQRRDSHNVADRRMQQSEADRRAAALQRARETLARYVETEAAFLLFLKWQHELSDCIQVLEGTP